MLSSTAVTKSQGKLASLQEVNSPNSQDNFQICCADMYLVRFLANFAGFRLFLWISQDFADLLEIRGSTTARNIRTLYIACYVGCVTASSWLQCMLGMVWRVFRGFTWNSWLHNRAKYQNPVYSMLCWVRDCKLMTAMYAGNGLESILQSTELALLIISNMPTRTLNSNKSKSLRHKYPVLYITCFEACLIKGREFLRSNLNWQAND